MYVVTGATGHIGNNVVRYLLHEGERVRVLVRQFDDSLKGLSLDVRENKVFNEQFLTESICENDIVIHAAGYINLYHKDKLQTFRTNYQLTKNIVEICIKKSCRLIYISSVDVIEKPKKGLIYEPSSFEINKKKSYYQESKWLATQYVYNSIKKGLNAIILYPSAVIGPYDFKPSQIGLEMKHILKNKVLFSIKGGYNFIDVRDVAKGIYLSSKKEISDHYILSGYNYSIKELYQLTSTITNQKKIIIQIPVWIVKIIVLFSHKYSKLMISSVLENYHYDDTKRKVHLFDELIGFEDTLEDTVKWLTR